MTQRHFFPTLSFLRPKEDTKIRTGEKHGCLGSDEVHVTTPRKIPENGSIWSKEEGTLSPFWMTSLSEYLWVFPQNPILLWGQWNILLSHFPNMLALSRVTMTSWGNVVLLSTIMLYFKCQHILMCRWPKEWVNVLPLRITELIFKQKRKRRRGEGEKEKDYFMYWGWKRP